MKIFKKVLSMLIVLALVVTLIGCGKTQDQSSTTTTPTGTTVEEPAKLKMFIRERWAGVGYDNLINDTIQEKTNTEWDMVIVPGAELMNKLNVMLAGGDRFDILNFPGDDSFELNLINEGLLLALDDYFDLAPNLYERNKHIWDSMRQDDGKIYSMNASVSESQVDFIPMYRKDWLDKFGLDVPKTIDEYFVVADKFSNDDPNESGKKDTFAFGGRGFTDSRLFEHIFSAYGILPFFWLEEDGKLIEGTVDPRAKEALRALNKLYKMGAIDPEFVTDNEERVKEKMLGGVYGALSYYTSIFDTNNRYNYYTPFHENNPGAELIQGPILDSDFKDDDNKVGMRELSPRGWVRTAVGSETKEIEAVMRVLDWYNSEEGVMFLNYGLENQHYTFKDNVVKSLVNENGQKELGITQLYLTMHWLPYHNSLELQEIVNYARSLGTGSPAFGIMIEETAQYQTDLYDYAKTQYLSIITGEVDVDIGFEQLLNEWEKRGGEKWVKAMNDAYQKRQ